MGISFQGDTKVLGLVDASTEDDFQTKLFSLSDKWDTIAPGFHEWFLKTEAEVFRNNMIASVREKAQLGSPPIPYTTNANESKNFVVKDWLQFKKNTMPDFITGYRSYIERCLQEAERAIYGAGEYLLSQEYRYLEVEASEWHRWIPEQRQKHLKKFRTAHAKAHSIPHEQANTVPDISTTSQKLTVPLDQFKIPDIPEATLKNIYSKAADLVHKQDAIMPAPGKKEGMMVDKKSEKRPHMVTKQQGGKFACDEGCRMFLSSRFCAHSATVAEKIQLLHQFILWHQKSHKGVNLARIVMNDVPKGAGRKGNKSPSKRYGNTKNRDDFITTTIDPYTTPQTPGSSTEKDSQAPMTPFQEIGFFFKWISRRITTCQGKCGRPMRMQDGPLYPSPYNLCIARKEQRSYMKKKSCVPDASYIKVPGDVRKRWCNSHRTHLESEFGQKE